ENRAEKQVLDVQTQQAQDTKKKSPQSALFVGGTLQYHDRPHRRFRPLAEERKSSMTTVATGSILSDALLEGCRQRAAGYDRDNKFCQEDFNDLKAAGYLKMSITKALGAL